jgi:hypothetical protein
MNLLTILALINCGFLLIYFFSRKSTGLTYTEAMVVRQISAYTIVLLTLLVVGFLWLKMYAAIHVLAIVINIILTVFMIFYFLRKLFK